MQPDALIDEIAEMQRAKLLRIAREIVPHATADDVLQPNDFPELEHNGRFRYEEGFLAGVLAVQMALRSRL